MKKSRLFSGFVSLVAGLLLMVPLLRVSAGLQAVSVPFPSSQAGAGGGGDSGAPLISADGRYVLFSSTANNLVTMGGSNGLPALLAPCLNVFLRDRLNAKTSLISVNQAGTGGGNGDSVPAGFSTNGQFVLFESSASNLVTNDTNGATDVFVRDVVNNTTTLVSATSAGASGNGESRSSVITPDGRFVAFVSAATNLVAGDTNQIPDIFVRDLQAGTSVLVSVGAESAPSGSSEAPVITPDGRYVAFYSTATNLVPGVTNSGEVYVRDLAAGTTTWASTNAATIIQSVMGATRAISYDPQISADGQFVAFTAKPATTAPPVAGIILRYGLTTGLTDIAATNAAAALSGYEPDAQFLDLTPDGRFVAFIANPATNTTSIYQWDALNLTTTLVSVNASNEITAGTVSSFPVQTPDGRFVAFFCNDPSLTTNPPAIGSLYLRDLQAGFTISVDRDTNGTGPGADASAAATLSDDGRFVAFERTDGNAVPNDSTHGWDVFVTDLTTATTELISAHDPVLPSLTPNGFSLLTSSCVSTNGRYVAFASEATDLVANDTNAQREIFVHDFLSGTNILVSADTNGAAAANGPSVEPSISPDGRWVAFTSSAANLVTGATTNLRNVYLRDVQHGTTFLISTGMTGGFGNGDSYLPTVSGDGRFILFHSQAQNLASGSYYSFAENLFLRDRTAGQTYALSSGATSTATWTTSMTPDGRFIAYANTAASSIYIWNSQLASRTLTVNVSSPSAVSISPNGQTLAYSSGYPVSLYVVNLSSNSTILVSAGVFPSNPGLRFSADGRFFAYATSAANVSADANATQDVYVYDIQGGTNQLISWNSTFTSAPNGASDSPSISPMGGSWPIGAMPPTSRSTVPMAFQTCISSTGWTTPPPF